MKYFIIWMFSSTLVVSIFILIMLFLYFIFKKRLLIHTNYSFWFVIILLLLMPYPLYSNLNVMGIFSPPSHSFSMEYKNEFTVPDAGFPSQNIIETPIHSEHVTKPEDITAAKNLNTRNINWVPVLRAAFSIWLLGFTFFMAAFLYGNIRFKMNIKKALVVDNEKILSVFNQVKAEIDIHKRIGIFESDSVDSMAIYGIFRPAIILKDVETFLHLDEEKLRLLFVHELIHYKNKDNLIKFICVFLKTLYWFNPLVWLVFNKLTLIQEIRCDERVVAFSNREKAKSYANLIFDIYEMLLPSSAFIKKEPMIKTRIQNILRQNNFKSTWSILSYTSIIFVVFISFQFVNLFFSDSIKQLDSVTVYAEENVADRQSDAVIATTKPDTGASMDEDITIASEENIPTPQKNTVTIAAKPITSPIKSGDKSQAFATQTATVLTQPPQPVWTSDTISWTAGANTADYEVKLYKDGSVIDTQTILAGINSLDYSNIIVQYVPGDFTVTIQAKGYGSFLDSRVSSPSLSNVKTVKLSTVTKPMLSPVGIATWINVANATYYQVQLYYNGSALGTAQTVDSGAAGFNFSSVMMANGPGTYTVKVVSEGEGLYYTADESVASNPQAVGPVATFNGTVENTFEPVTQVNTSTNCVVVTKVEPTTTLSAGVETILIVEVEYNLLTANSATLSINSNVGGYTMTSVNEIEISKLKVYKGYGKLRFTLTIIPKLWDNGASFFILSKLYQNGNYYCSSPKVILDVK